MSCLDDSVWNRSLKIYGVHNILSRAYFWTPIFILYFSRIVELKEIFLLEAIYYVTVFLMEVPSGYFSDSLGRKKTLILSGLFFTISYALFFVGGSFFILGTAQVFLALGFSFLSGTDTSLHFGLLSALKKEKEYGSRESKLASAGLVVSALSAAAGGMMAWAGAYRGAYGLSFLFALAVLFLSIMMRDPDKECLEKNQKALSPVKQLKAVAVHLREPNLKFLFSFTVFITVLNHIPYEFYQLYIQNFIYTAQGSLNKLPITLATGFHTALTLLISAFLARHTMKLRKKLGTRGYLYSLLILQGIIIGSLLLSGEPVVVILLLMRSLPGALSAPVVRELTSPKLPSGLRATYFSVQSLSGRLAFTLTLILFHFLPGGGYRGSLLLAEVGVLLFLIILFFLARKGKTTF